MGTFQPDYNNIVQAAKNIKPDRFPLYEHIIAPETIEKIQSTELIGLYNSDKHADIRLFLKRYCKFFYDMGYDTVSWEICLGPIMPGSGALGGHQPGVIQNRQDFEKYPWDKMVDLYFDQTCRYFEALRQEMPEGMKAIGGVGNGVFEVIQELVGYQDLCMMKIDDPQLYGEMFKTVGDLLHSIWKKFLADYGDIFAVCRFGDDLGFKSSTLLDPTDIKEKIVPQYKRIVDLVHSYDKPFLLHSCGCIFDVMDEMIELAGIDAKHSNEDVIAPFSTWLEKYGKRIGNFGGIDMDILCQNTPAEIFGYTRNVMDYSCDSQGVAFGSGNSIPDYVPVDGYLAMINAVKEHRKQ